MDVANTDMSCMHTSSPSPPPPPGADVLFEDPGRRSTSVGVTVSPVRVASLEQFGDLGRVGAALLDSEGKKVSKQGSRAAGEVCVFACCVGERGGGGFGWGKGDCCSSSA
jgi:hypothetical protein